MDWLIRFWSEFIFSAPLLFLKGPSIEQLYVSEG